MKQLLFFAMLYASVSSALPQAAQSTAEPVLVDQVAPAYPPLAKTARVTGQVKVEFVVNNAGDVVSAIAVSGPPMLAPAAVDAVNAWKFRIPQRNSLEDLHLATTFDYVIGSSDQQPVFDSFRHVTLTGVPVALDDYGARLCPSIKKVQPLGTDENAALVELGRAQCYIDWPNPGSTPLMHAVVRPDLAKVRKLLMAGADVSARDANGWTAFMYASVLGDSLDDSSVISLLLSAGADPNQSSFLGNSALMVSAAHGDLLPELLRSGASLNAQNSAGTTVLMILADRAGSDEIAAALKAGADAAFRDHQNRTALDYLYLARCDRSPIPDVSFEKQSSGQAECPHLNTDDASDVEHFLKAAYQRRQVR